MSERHLPRPTDAELEILRALWRRGPSTVREVHEDLPRVHPTRYTTTLKLMQIMAEKGLLARDEAQRAHVYRPRLPEDQTLKQLTRDLLERAFGGSAETLVMHALQAKKVSPTELANIRELLDGIEGSRK